jgi:hypothetical protein
VDDQPRSISVRSRNGAAGYQLLSRIRANTRLASRPTVARKKPITGWMAVSRCASEPPLMSNSGLWPTQPLESDSCHSVL